MILLRLFQDREQKHYFHLWGLQKLLVAFATRDFFRPHS
jgi:hypothetical protein